MKKIIFTMVLVAAVFSAKAQESFESVTLDSGKVLNGSLGETEYAFTFGFTDLHLPTFWDTSFGGYWASGWALSKKHDSVTMTSNFSRHLYCNKAFKGFDGSDVFAIGQNHAYMYQDRAAKAGISAFYITNTTYAYNSMKFGDAFGKKFGGSSGHDSDYFFCRIKTYHHGVFQDSQDIYLADFRSSDSTKDYILSEWKLVNVTPLTDSVTFDLYSSDNASWGGMNTPGFFALDYVHYTIFENIEKISKNDFKAWPNPASDAVYLSGKKAVRSVEIYAMDGRKVGVQNGNNLNEIRVATETLPTGIYVANILTESGISRVPFMVKH